MFSRNAMRLWWATFSRISDAIGDIDIGQWFSDSVESPGLKTGVIFAIFQTRGTEDVLIDKLIMYARRPAIISAQLLSRPGGNSSIPGAFCLFRALSSFRMNLLDMKSNVKCSLERLRSVPKYLQLFLFTHFHCSFC